MDPIACWKRLINALADGDVNESIDAAEDLATWVGKGGDVPPVVQAAYEDLELL